MDDARGPGRGEQTWDVIVIGLGPTGSALANLLGLQGIRTLTVERDRDIHNLPRAVHFDDEVMRVFQTIGVAEEAAAVSRINPGMRFVDAEGGVLLDWPRPMEVSPQGWHPSYRFHQPDLDRILRSTLCKRPSVETMFGAEAVTIAESSDRATVQIRNTGADQTENHEARYVIGCDGARSLARGYIGGGSIDLGFHERWLVVDVLLKLERPDLGDVTVQHCDPAQPATYVRGPGNRRRWEIALVDEHPGVRADAPEEIWRRLSRWITPDDADIERAAIYTFHALIAEQWRKGRVFIAGDAAHQTPPFMGQGMCAGVRDAANLAWKLARSVRGEAGSALLESYQGERQANAQVFIETAVKLGRLVSASGSTADLEAAFKQPDGSVRMASILPRLGPGLADQEDPRGGVLFPQPNAGSALLDDVTGYELSVIAQADLCHDLAPILKEEAIRAVPADPDTPLSKALDDLGVQGVVVRPDRYILGSLSRAADLRSLLDRLPLGAR